MGQNDTDADSDDGASRWTRRALIIFGGGSIASILGVLLDILQLPLVIRRYWRIISESDESDDDKQTPTETSSPVDTSTDSPAPETPTDSPAPGTPTPQPPDAHMNIEPEFPDPGQEVLLDGTGSFAPDGTIERYRWLIKTFPGGTHVAEKCCQAKETHTFKRGDYEITLTVTDSNNNRDSDVKFINVGDDTEP